MQNTIERLDIDVRFKDNLNDGASRLEELAVSIDKIKNAAKGGANLTAFTNQLSKLTSLTSSIDLGALEEASGSIVEFQKAMGQKEDGAGLTQLVRDINRIPKALKDLDTSKMGEFNKMLKESVDVTQNASNYMEHYATALQYAANSSKLLGDEEQTRGKKTSLLNKTLGGVKVATLASFKAGQVLARGVGHLGQVYGKMDGTMNLVRSSMGSYAQEAYDYSRQVQDMMYIDSDEFLRGNALMMNMAQGFGVAEANSYKMSKGLTELSYDLAAFINDGRDSADMLGVMQSAMAGQIEPIRKMGFALDRVTLQEVARSQGINKNINDMNQAEKAQLRYIAVVEQATNMDIFGTYAKQITNPTVAMSALRSQINSFVREIAGTFVPILMKAMPYIHAFAMALMNAVRWLASLFGIDIKPLDVGGWEKASKSIGGVADNFDNVGKNAGKAQKKIRELVKDIAGFDDVHVMSAEDDPNAGGGGSLGGIGGGGGFDDLMLPETPKFLEDLTSKTKALAKQMEGLGKVAVIVGAVLAGMWAVGKVVGFVNGVKGLLTTLGLVKVATEGTEAATSAFNSALGLTLGGILGLITSFTIIATSWSEMSVGAQIASVALAMISGAMVAVGVTAMATGTTIAAAISVATLGIGAIIGAVVAAIAVFANWVTQTISNNKALYDTETATLNLKEAKEQLRSTTRSHIDAIKAEEKALEELQAAEKDTGLSGKSLEDQVKNGTLSYKDMNAEQRRVYEAYIELEDAQDKVSESTKKLEEDTKANTLAEFEQAVTVANSADEFQAYKRSVIDAMEQGALSTDEARDLIEKAMGKMSTASHDTFMEDLPDDVKKGLNPTQYSTALEKFTSSFGKAFDGIGSWFGGIWDTIKTKANETINIKTKTTNQGGGGGTGGGGGGGRQSVSAASGPSGMASYSQGTNYLPQTGLYWGHEGEQIIPKGKQGAPYQESDSAVVDRLETVINVLLDILDKDSDVIISASELRSTLTTYDNRTSKARG